MCGFWMQRYFRRVKHTEYNYTIAVINENYTRYLYIYSAEKPTRLYYIIFQSLGNLLYLLLKTVAIFFFNIMSLE